MIKAMRIILFAMICLVPLVQITILVIGGYKGYPGSFTIFECALVIMFCVSAKFERP